MAANVQAVCTSFKVEILKALHALGTTVIRAGTGADTLKMAFYTTGQSLGAATTAYGATGEVAASGDYSAGGDTVTNATTPTNDGTVAIWTPSANVTNTGVTWATFDAALLYNSTQSNRAIAVYTFGSQQITAGNFTLTMPANAAATALLQIA